MEIQAGRPVGRGRARPRHAAQLAVTVAALATAVAAALIAPGDAQGAESFGYGDPRSAQIEPLDVSALDGGGFLSADFNDARGEILRYEDGRLRAIAGGGKRDPGLEPQPASELRLFALQTVAATADGWLGTLAGSEQVIGSDSGNRVRVVAGIGTGPGGTRDDGVPATQARLSLTSALDPLPGGGFLLGETDRIREVGPDGRIRTLVGPGTLDGEGVPARDARVASAYGVLALPGGGLLYTDRNRVREVSAAGIVTTIAGTGEPGFSGDGGPATAARLDTPLDLTRLTDGSILVSDFENHRIRRIAPDGTISTVAGTGSTVYNGDGIPATAAAIDAFRIAATADGGFLLTDGGRIRKVSAGGTISTLAGIPADPDCGAAPYAAIQGGPGDEELRGGDRRDLIRGEQGDDLLLGRGDTDCLVGGDGRDELRGRAAADALAGSGGRDLLIGAAGRDVMRGDEDDDRLLGGGGRDDLDGGNRSDHLSGDGGGDDLYGGRADDRLAGGAGGDRIEGGLGSDVLLGGSGDDLLIAVTEDRGAFRNVVRCGPGRDVARVSRDDRVARSCERVRIGG
jgi:Ca2+-binding RTX toxin-like protein